MRRVLTLHQTTIGKKALMAITGAMMFGFLIAHLLGNLQLFLGLSDPDQGAIAMGEYAASLRQLGPLLWVMRIGLLLAILIHIWAVISLVSRNGDARPKDYAHKRKDQVTSYAARTMKWGGLIIALFVVYHIMHLTLGIGGDWTPHNPYNNAVLGFQKPLISIFYIIANLLVAFHLFHGAWSWMQSLGISHPRYDKYRTAFALALAVFIGGGNVIIPASVLLGALEPSELTDSELCFEELSHADFECEVTTVPTPE